MTDREESMSERLGESSVCIFHALGKCKTEAERSTLLKALKAVIADVDAKTAICVSNANHTWKPEQVRPHSPVWQCNVCNVVTHDKVLADNRLRSKGK